ncbi:MAG: inositol monophosphatase [Cytophagales bacterium]|nr:MAG: inositol monophosphatase [Cytophagales bacterium]
MKLEKICQKVVALVKEVGYFLKKEQENFDTSRIEYKGLNNLVSYVDREAEKKLMEGLEKIVREAAFVSEEDKSLHQLTNKTYHWVIDPLDGTTNFMHRIPIFAISIALMQEREVVLGVVYEVSRNECFYAWKNGNAFCNEARIQVSQNVALSQSLLATGFPYGDFDKMIAYLNTLNEFMQKTHGLRRMGSAAVDLAYTACGRFEGFFEYNLSPWDVAGGSIIVKEAGGKVSTFSGTDDFVFGKEIVAATPTVHKEMLQVIEQCWD